MRKRRLMASSFSSNCSICRRPLRSMKAANSSVPITMLRGIRRLAPGNRASVSSRDSRELMKATPRALPPRAPSVRRRRLQSSWAEDGVNGITLPMAFSRWMVSPMLSR